MRNERGNILVSALIGAGIVSATGLALATMMTQMNHESRSLAQKLEIMQLEQTMMGDLANSAICGCNFDPANTFNSTSGNLSTITVPLTNLYSSCDGGVPGNPTATANNQPLNGSQSGLKVSDVQLTNITRKAPGSYSGDLLVKFTPSSLIISRKPAKVTINLTVDDTTDPTAAKVTGCVAGRGGGGAGSIPQCTTIKHSAYFGVPSDCSLSGGSGSITGLFTCSCPSGTSLFACLDSSSSGSGTCRTNGGVNSYITMICCP